MPNAHYISRASGGLGVEENIMTLCIGCHYHFDSGNAQERKELKEKARSYLMSKYQNWDEGKLTYRKWR